MEPYNQCINVRITTKDTEKEDRLCLKSPPKEGDIVEMVFFKFILLFLVLTYQLIYKHPSQSHLKRNWAWHNFWNPLTIDL